MFTSENIRARSPGQTAGLDNPPSAVFLVLSMYFSFIVFLYISLFTFTSCSPKPLQITPQSEEHQSEASRTTVAQNVKFSDAHAGFAYDNTMSYDPVRSSAFQEDVTLDNFFRRPVNIFQESWQVNVNFLEVINPWKLYFENPRVINRLSNYRLMSAKLKLKVMLNGNSFYFGRAIASYLPLAAADDMSVKLGYTLTDMVFLSQRPHIYLDPTNSQGGEMTLPFFSPWNTLATTALQGGSGFDVGPSWEKMGEMSLYSFSNLQHANGATDPVTITILAWAEDVKLSVPTQYDASGITPQSDEYKLSTTASAIAAWAGKLASAPYIGMYARATEIGASAVAGVAKLFGYSRPADVSVTQYRPVIKSSFATTDTHDELYKLTVDSKQELSIDPRIAGIDVGDELVLSHIASRETWIYQFDWSVTDASQTKLFSILVDPCIHREVTSGLDKQLKLPACCFAGAPFAQWRGSMKYRFQAASSGFHKGRLKIVYDPVGSKVTAEDNISYITYLDLAEETDTTIEVGWGQVSPYRETIRVGTSTEAAMFNTSITTDVQFYGNGTLSVYVVNELTVPNSTAPVQAINMNVFVSACDDIEFAAPTNTTISRLRLDTSNTITPQSMEISEEQMRADSAPSNTIVENTMGVASATHEAANLVHFGERISSFRQMLKRYSLHEMPIFTPSASLRTVVLRLRRQLFPYWGGYTSDGAVSDSILTTLSAGNYAYSYTTLLQYITSGYAGYRGGTRYLVDASAARSNTNHDGSLLVSREDNRSYEDGHPSRSVLSWTGSSITSLATLYNQFINVTGVSGIARTALSVNPTLGFEVPYYSELRFTPAKTKPSFAPFGMGEFNIPFSMWLTIFPDAGETAPESIFLVYVAGAEDFTPLFYTGPPVFYYEGSMPSS